MVGPIKPKKTERVSTGGRFGESGRSARLSKSGRGDPREGRAARAQRTTEQLGEHMTRDQLGRDTVDIETIADAVTVPVVQAASQSAPVTVSNTKTTIVDSDVNVFVDGALIASRRGIDFTAGSNVTLVGLDQPTVDRVQVEIAASGGGSGLSDGDYGDVSVSGGGTTLTVDNDVVTFAKMQNISTDRLIGRDTAGSGDPEQIEISPVLDWVGSTQGQVLYRDASKWAALAAGTSGQFLKTNGAGANPEWDDASSLTLDDVLAAIELL